MGAYNFGVAPYVDPAAVKTRIGETVRICPKKQTASPVEVTKAIRSERGHGSRDQAQDQTSPRFGWHALRVRGWLLQVVSWGYGKRKTATLSDEDTTGQPSPVMDELPRDVVQALPVVNSNGLQLPLRPIEHLVCARSCTGAADGNKSNHFGGVTSRLLLGGVALSTASDP